MSPNFFHFTGNYDASGKVLEMRGRGFDCMLQAETNYRTREEHSGPGQKTFEMFMETPDGQEVKMFTHVYTRV
jgi:hypothetical protein